MVLAVGLAGCAETTLTYTPLNTPPHDLRPRAPEQLQIFSSAPARPHVDVGLIFVQEGLTYSETPESLIAALRDSGAARGCDALLLAPPGVATTPTTPLAVGASSRLYTATCIAYLTTEPGDAAATFAVPGRAPDHRRMCLDWADFDAHRNCVLDTRHH
jgi:hypothetical protein